MDKEGPAPGWLLLLTQLPSSPSSARVALWRRLRAIGAAGLLNGAWVLPRAAAHAGFFEQLRETVHGQGGTAFVLTISVESPDGDEPIARIFRADRGREYDEFTERCEAFLDEIGKETRAGKFTFAELEEGEQDAQKLARWLAKIQARDFFPDERSTQSADLLGRCRRALEGFAWAVYAAEGCMRRPGSGMPARRRRAPLRMTPRRRPRERRNRPSATRPRALRPPPDLEHGVPANNRELPPVYELALYQLDRGGSAGGMAMPGPFDAAPFRR
jgi:hypothetical protein